ncbi:MAG: hypothetical protein ACOY5U_03245 [Pseudomonadota bacterium]
MLRDRRDDPHHPGPRAQGLRRLARAALLAAAGALGTPVAVTPAAAEPVRVSVDPSVRFQTIHGWEATANLLWEDDLDGYRDEVFDRLLDEVGITRIRLEVFSGAENTDRSFRRHLAGEITEPEWRRRRFATVNDDADPFHINPAGFDFADLDWRVDNVVLPLMQRAEARGMRLDINLCYVAFTDQMGAGGTYLHTDPEEYAEFILATWLHLRDRYGFVPDSLEPLLEPDLVKEWSPQKLGLAMAAATRRLREAGFSPRLAAPSVTSAANAVPWFDGIAAVPGATDAIFELSYHRYKGATLDNLRAIAARARAAGVPSAMLEFWNGRGTYNLLHTDLAVADAAAWQGRAVMGFYHRDRARPQGKQLVMNEDTRYNSLYFRNIPPGAERVGAGSSDPASVNPLAFLNPDGSMTVMLRSDTAGPVEVSGLVPGAYAFSEATEVGTTVPADPVAVDATGTARIQLGGRGVAVLTSWRRAPVH